MVWRRKCDPLGKLVVVVVVDCFDTIAIGDTLGIKMTSQNTQIRACRPHRRLEPDLQTIKVVMHIFLHRHNIVQRMHFRTIQIFDIIAKTLQNCQN